jgi:hypothetical protein
MLILVDHPILKRDLAVLRDRAKPLGSAMGLFIAANILAALIGEAVEEVGEASEAEEAASGPSERAGGGRWTEAVGRWPRRAPQAGAFRR